MLTLASPSTLSLSGPVELAKWIRALTGAPPSLKLVYDVARGGWSTVGGEFVGRNVPTIRAALEGYVLGTDPTTGDRRIALLDGSDVTEKTSLPDVAAAERALTTLRRTWTTTSLVVR